MEKRDRRVAVPLRLCRFLRHPNALRVRADVLEQQRVDRRYGGRGVRTLTETFDRSGIVLRRREPLLLPVPAHWQAAVDLPPGTAHFHHSRHTRSTLCLALPRRARCHELKLHLSTRCVGDANLAIPAAPPLPARRRSLRLRDPQPKREVRLVHCHDLGKRGVAFAGRRCLACNLRPARPAVLLLRYYLCPREAQRLARRLGLPLLVRKLAWRRQRLLLLPAALPILHRRWRVLNLRLCHCDALRLACGNNRIKRSFG